MGMSLLGRAYCGASFETRSGLRRLQQGVAPPTDMMLPALLLMPSLLLSNSIESRFAEIEAASTGRVGVAVVTPKVSHFHRRNERFSLQSVMKLMVSMAALEQVDKGRWKLDQKFDFKRSDLSIAHQPILERLGSKKSIRISLSDLIDLAVTQSCSAAADFMIRKMGGVQAVNSFLARKGIEGMSVDRQERDLQSAIAGLAWNPAYSDDAKLEEAASKVPDADQDAAYLRYQKDVRDTSTPAAMADLLRKLVTGKLLSVSSTRHLLKVMEKTSTGPNRLKVGVPKGWTLGHKTGTSSTHKGLAWATNDVGIARNSKGEWVILVAFLKGSTLDPEGRDQVLRRVAEAAFSKK